MARSESLIRGEPKFDMVDKPHGGSLKYFSL